MFLHTFHPSPLIIDIGFIQIYWYGVLICLAVIVNFLIAKKLFKKYNLKLTLLRDLSFYLLIYGLIGARVWHVLSEISYYIEYPLDIIKIWNGGLAIHGAILGGVIAILSRASRLKGDESRDPETGSTDHGIPRLNSSRRVGICFARDKLLLLDIFAPLLALGQAIGRWGNYFNQELFGQPTNLPWSIPIDFINRINDYAYYQFFHPIFLYESLWCLLLFIILIVLHCQRFTIHNLQLTTDNNQKSPVVNQKLIFVSRSGVIFLTYLILYSIERFLIGFLRIDSMVDFIGLRLDQWTSLLLIIVGVTGMLFLNKLINPKI